MAPNVYKTFSSLLFKLDSSTGRITDITNVTNNAALNGAMNILEALAIGDKTKTIFPGIGSATFSLNGWVNSTSEGIFAPLVGNNTSVYKTFAMFNGYKYLTGESLPSKVAFSGKADDMITWSADFTVNGAVTRTAVSPT